MRAKKRQSEGNTVKSYWSYKQFKIKGSQKLLLGRDYISVCEVNRLKMSFDHEKFYYKMSV